jgi:hypothetical protein
MPVELQAPTGHVALGLNPEDLATLRVQHVRINQVVDVAAGLERGVQLNQWLRPQEALGQLLVYEVSNALIADRYEAGRVLGVVLDQVSA